MQPVRRRTPSWVWWAAAGLILLVLSWEHFPVAGAHRAKDWQYFFHAAEALRDGTDLYASRTDDSGEWAYVYPPLLAFVLTPLVPLGFVGSARVWVALIVAGLAAGLVLVSGEASRRLPGGRRPARLGCAVFVGLLLSVNVARREIEHAQTDWLTMLAFAAGLVWMDRRPLLAGAALGLAANLKYHTLIAVPYLLVRGRVKAAASTAAFAIGGALLPAVMIGWDRNLEYLTRAFGGIAQFVGIEVPRRASVWAIEDPDSISATSALSRLSGALGHGTGLTLALTGAAACGCLGLAWWMYRAHGVAFWFGARTRIEDGSHGPPRRICDLAAGRREDGKEDGVGAGLAVAPGAGEGSGVRGQGSESATPGPLVLMAEWAGLIVATVAFSPQTLKRHFFVLVPVYAITVVLLLSRRGRAGGGVESAAGARGWFSDNGVLLAGLVVSMLSMFLPPRWDGVEAVSNVWRAAGGTCWCQLVLFFALLWTALAWERGESCVGRGADSNRQRVTSSTRPPDGA